MIRQVNAASRDGFAVVETQWFTAENVRDPAGLEVIREFGVFNVLFLVLKL